MVKKTIPIVALVFAFTVVFSTVSLAYSTDAVLETGTESELVEPQDTNKKVKVDSLKTEELQIDDKLDIEIDKPVDVPEVEEKTNTSAVSFNLIFEIIYRFNFSDLLDFTPSKKTKSFIQGI